MDLGFETAAAVRDGLSLERLEAAVGPRHARFLWGICRGMDDSEVVQRQKAKTLLAAKNFESSHRVDAAVSWLRILAQELVERMSFEEKHHNRFPRTLTCTFRLHCRATSAFTNVSRAHAMPGPSVKNRAGALVDIAHGLLVKTIESGIDYRLPINFVGLTGSNFSERAVGKVGFDDYPRILDCTWSIATDRFHRFLNGVAGCMVCLGSRLSQIFWAHEPPSHQLYLLP